MTKIRGGRTALDRLIADLQVFRSAARDILDYSTNVRLVEDAARDILCVERDLAAFVNETLEPMLERVERRAPYEVAELERRIAALEARVTQLDLERRGVVPFPDRKQERR
jgi:hypothetical protein